MKAQLFIILTALAIMSCCKEENTTDDPKNQRDEISFTGN